MARARAGNRSRGGDSCAFQDENAMDAIFLLLKLGVKRIVKASLVSLAVMGSSCAWYSGAVPYEEPPPKIDGALLFTMFQIGFIVALPLQEILHGLCRVNTVKPAILLAAFVALTTACVAVKPKPHIDAELMLKLAVVAAHSFVVTLSAIVGEILLCCLDIFKN